MAEQKREVRLIRLDRLSNEMRTQTDALGAVPNLRGWVLGGASGDVVLAAMPNAFDNKMLDAIGKTLIQTADAFQEQAQDALSEMELRYENAHILLRRVGTAWLAAWCDVFADFPMLRLTLNVAVPIIEKDKGLQSALNLLTRKG